MPNCMPASSEASEALKGPAAQCDALAQPLAADLKRKSVVGGVAAVSAQGAKFVVQTATVMVLARLLSPEDFGLQGMVVVVTGFLGLFRDVGLGSATVQRLEITHEQTSTLLWINVAIGAILATLCAALAPVLVAFYQEPRLYWVAVISGTTFLFNGLAIRHAGKDRCPVHDGRLRDGHSHGIARLPLLVPSRHGDGHLNRRCCRGMDRGPLGSRATSAQVRYPVDAPFWRVDHL